MSVLALCVAVFSCGRNGSHPEPEAWADVVDGIDAWPVVSRAPGSVHVGGDVKATVAQMGRQHGPNPAEVPEKKIILPIAVF